MSTRIRNLLDSLYDAKRERLHAKVASAPMINGRSAGYVIATVGGSENIPVVVSPDARKPVAVGDEILVESRGNAATATYYMVDRFTDNMPDSDVYIFPSATTVGGMAYEPGDILLGSTLANWSNWWYQFQYGRWLMRKGTVMQGAIGNLLGLYDYTQTIYGSAFGEYGPGKVWLSIDPVNGMRIVNYDTRSFQVDMDGNIKSGYENQAEIIIAPGEQQIQFVTNGIVQSAIDADSRTIYGFERLGRPLGPCIEWGPIPDASGQENLERWGMWLRNKEGERFFAVLSGTDANPDEAYVRVGVQNSGNSLEWADGVLTIAGQVTATSGTIGGWNIGATTLSSANVTLANYGLISLGTSNNIVKLNANDATWRLAIGHATMSSAPFRVSKNGALYAESVNITAGNTIVNGDGISLARGEEVSSGINWTDGISGSSVSRILTNPDSNLSLEANGNINLTAHLGDVSVNTNTDFSVSTGATGRVLFISNKLAFFGVTGSTQAAYSASPTVSSLRDIFVRYGLMAAS